MKYIIPDLKITPGKSCLYSSLYDLMSYYKLNLTESDIFFLCDGFNFEYEGADEKAAFSPGERLNLYSYDQWLSVFTEVLRIKPHTENTVKSSDRFYDLCRILYEDDLVLLLIDSKCLTYHPRHHQLGTIRDTHSVILYGIDAEDESAYIGDSYIVENSGAITCFSGPFPVDKIAAGIKGVIWFEIDENKGIPRERVTGYIIENFEKFIKEEKDGKMYKGNLALLKCIEDIGRFKEMNGSQFESACTEIVYFLSSHYFCKFDYLSSFLISEMKLYKFSYAGIIEKIGLLKKEWSGFSTQLLKTGYARDKCKIDGILEDGIQLIRKQAIFFLDVINYMKSTYKKNY